ncbi:MAG: M42 family metallopeptidase [Anaerolineales bacterium]|nr:M42 family metallopeptidase [Anaerolineales bacterium]
MKELVKKLTQTTAPSGYETNLRSVIEEELKGSTDQIRVDGLGNMIVRKGPEQPGAPTIMLAAHMDEIGLMVTHVDENGFARFTNIGGVFPRYTAGARVRFLNGAAGVIGIEPHSNTSSVPALDKMFIDTGVSSAKQSPVEIGDVAVFERTFEDLGDRLVSKAMDDRAGIAVLIEAFRQLKKSPNNVYAVFTVQEEVGARGAGRAAFGLEPDLALVVDVTLCGDTPQNKETQVFLGKGPAVHIKDLGTLADPRVTGWIKKGAQRARIPIQTSILTRGYTDTYTIQTSRAGVPAGGIAIPCRYIHSPSEMVDVSDLTNSVKLLAALLSKPISL